MRAGFTMVSLGAGAAAACICLACAADAPKPDGGKFTLMLQGRAAGTDTFRLLPDGCDSDVSFAVGNGQTVQFHQTVKYRKGQWTQVTTDAGPQGTLSLALAGDKSTLKVNDKAATKQKLPATVFPYGDRSPHLLAFLVAAYDTKRGGDQKFEMLFTEAVGPKGIVTLPAVVKEPVPESRIVGGKRLGLLRYSASLVARTGTVAMDIMTDKDKHVLYWNVPSQRYSGVREGFQELAKPAN